MGLVSFWDKVSKVGVLKFFTFIYMIYFSRTLVPRPTFPFHWQTSKVTFLWSLWDAESSFTELLLLPLSTDSCFSSRNTPTKKEVFRSIPLSAFSPLDIPDKVNECWIVCFHMTFLNSWIQIILQTLQVVPVVWFQSYQFYLTWQSYCTSMHIAYQVLTKHGSKVTEWEFVSALHHSLSCPSGWLC